MLGAAQQADARYRNNLRFQGICHVVQALRLGFLTQDSKSNGPGLVNNLLRTAKLDLSSIVAVFKDSL